MPVTFSGAGLIERAIGIERTGIVFYDGMDSLQSHLKWTITIARLLC